MRSLLFQPIRFARCSTLSQTARSCCGSTCLVCHSVTVCHSVCHSVFSLSLKDKHRTQYTSVNTQATRWKQTGLAISHKHCGFVQHLLCSTCSVRCPRGATPGRLIQRYFLDISTGLSLGCDIGPMGIEHVANATCADLRVLQIGGLLRRIATTHQSIFIALNMLPATTCSNHINSACSIEVLDS